MIEPTIQIFYGVPVDEVIDLIETFRGIVDTPEVQSMIWQAKLRKAKEQLEFAEYKINQAERGKEK